MATKHTPGPWRAQFSEDHNGTEIERRIYPTGKWEVIDANNESVTGWGRVRQPEAVARLIAAAPDLLAICKRMDSFLEDIDAKVYRAFQTLHADILCAIAKAEGA